MFILYVGIYLSLNSHGENDRNKFSRLYKLLIQKLKNYCHKNCRLDFSTVLVYEYLQSFTIIPNLN